MGWRLFKATDTGAPSAALNVTGQLAAILRACLITGYGSKSPVGGWEEPWPETAGVSVFRATTGNRQFYQIQDSTAGAVPFRAYESMSDINTGTGQWFFHNFGKYYSTTAMNWIVLANEVTVFFFGISRYGWTCQMFGEYESSFTGDSYNNIVCGSPITQLRGDYTAFGNAPTVFYLGPAVGQGAYFHRLPDGTGLGVYTWVQPHLYSYAEGMHYSYLLDTANFPQKKPVFSSLVLAGPPDTTAAPSGTDYYQRNTIFGFIPKLLAVDCSFFAAGTAIDATMEWTDAATGLVYLILAAGNGLQTTNYRAGYIIPLGDVT